MFTKVASGAKYAIGDVVLGCHIQATEYVVAKCHSGPGVNEPSKSLNTVSVKINTSR